MKIPLECGIYRLFNTKTGECYVGSSINIHKRWIKHLSRLRLKEHHSEKLQSDWEFFGAHNFTLEILELCDEEQLVQREQYYIDTLHPLYNVRQIVRRGLKGNYE